MPIPTCPAFPFSDPQASHLVHDPLTGDAIVIAPGRRYRPDGQRNTVVTDPFSPKGLKHQVVLKTFGTGANIVTAIENNYPIFHQDRPLEGRQEILVEGRSLVPFSQFPVARMNAAIDAMADRSRSFRKDPRLKFMVVFKNEGKEAGASQPHPHSQIYGMPFVPDRLIEMAHRRKRILKQEKMTAHAYMLKQATESRQIYSDRSVVAFADPFSRIPYGVQILTRRPIDNITQVTLAERASLAKALHALMPFIQERGYAYNLYFHDVFGQFEECFEIRFAPRMNIWGAFELDAGVVVNPVPAECAAAEYLAAKT